MSTYSNAKCKILRWIPKVDGDVQKDFGFVRSEHGHNVYVDGWKLWECCIDAQPKPGDTIVLNYCDNKRPDGSPGYKATKVVAFKSEPELVKKPWGSWKGKNPEVIGTFHGLVKWFDLTKGFGFIRLDRPMPGRDEEDVFVHADEVASSADAKIGNSLMEGDWIQFCAVKGKRGPIATKLLMLEAVSVSSAGKGAEIISLDEHRTGTGG